MKHIYPTAFTKEEYELLHGKEPSDKIGWVIKTLEGMLWGIECKMSYMRYRMAESSNGGLVIVSINGSGDDEHILGHPELSIRQWSEQIHNGMTQEEFDLFCMTVASSKTLTKINRRDG